MRLVRKDKVQGDVIERSIEAALNHLATNWGSIRKPGSDASWTRAVKNRIGALGRRHRYAVYAAGSRYSRLGEWLFDLIWLKMGDETVLDFPLALECEWSPGKETLWDFQKLLVSRARHRVLVMYARNEKTADRTIEDLIGEVRKFKQTRGGDRYMFACYLGDRDRFHCHVHVA